MEQSSFVPGGLEDVFHPSDFSEASEVAFAHALKIALVTGSRLHMLHVAEEEDVDWHDFPGVRETLERWKILPPQSPRHAVAEAGLRVNKVVVRDPDPVHAALSFLRRHPADLVVLATHRRDGRVRWLSPSVAEPIARDSGTMTLFLPEGVKGFVAWEDGSLSLRSILIPVAADPSPRMAIEAAARAARRLQLPEARFILFHAGEAIEWPFVPDPEPGWTWERVGERGEPVGAILRAAEERRADLIVMTTSGEHGFLDALRGSTTERVLHAAPCPLLAIPAG